MKSYSDVARDVLGTVLNDGPWQDIGFGRRPRHGALFQRFRTQWRVDLEKAILREMVIVLTAAHVASGVVEHATISGLVKLYVDGPGAGTELWRAFGYASREEAREHLGSSIAIYAQASPDQWPSIMGARLGVSSVPDNRIAARLLVGTVTFTQTAQDMIAHLRLNSSHAVGTW